MRNIPDRTWYPNVFNGWHEINLVAHKLVSNSLKLTRINDKFTSVKLKHIQRIFNAENIRWRYCGINNPIVFYRFWLNESGCGWLEYEA
jgi:hypothetical protein